MPITSFGPSQSYPHFKSVVYEPASTSVLLLNSGNTPITLTAAQTLGNLLVCNCDDNGTLTLPTAALLNAAIPAPAVGVSFDLDIVNVGDSTITVAVGTGGTLVAGNSKSTVATIATVKSKRFKIVITGVATQAVVGSSDSYTVYGFGEIAAAVA